MKILIIEDEPGIRQTLQDMLEINGHSVMAAADGVAGVQLAAQSPDLILCDIAMPGMDGYEVIAAIQQLPASREVPFIFLTARADRDDQRRGMALGADDYITKPFSEREILEAIAARVLRQQPIRERIEHLLNDHRLAVSANWSHELLTPLVGVLGGLEMIEEEADRIQPGELRDLLRLIRGGAERQQTLSRKLILHYELERLKGVTPRTNLFYCDAPAAITAGAARAAEEEQRYPDLTVQCAPGAVPVSESHLLATIAELVGNAFRFSKPGQGVAVTGNAHPQGYRIEIIDQGPGLTPEQCAQIGPFVQFGRERREQQGLGLGLAIARSVAEIAGGRLILQPGPAGRGLHVTLDLPPAVEI